MSERPPATPQRREIEIMRVLFDRRLKGRAIALADSRWPGSGKMVDLAYEWGELDANERRERLSAIGPEEVARLREFTALNPELAAAVDELERRGVLPHLEAAAAASAAAAQTAFVPESTTARRDQQSRTAREESSSTAEPIAEERVEVERPDTNLPLESSASEIQTDMPTLDLGLPSTSAFLSDQAHQRLEAAQAAEATMDRVRQRLEQSTQRAFDRSAATTLRTAQPLLPTPSRSEPDVRSGQEPRSTRTRAIEAPASLLHRIRNHQVTALGSTARAPSDDELLSLANDLQIGFKEFTLVPGGLRDVFGGLVAQLGHIEVVPGPFPRAIAEPNLIVVRGRLSPHLSRRIEEGFLDIPGTRASVRVHPDARVLVLPA